MSTVMEKAKSLVGHMLRNVHASNDQLASAEALAPTTLTISSLAFQAGMAIPSRFTQEGESISPSLNWENIPSATRELVLVCEDPDAPKSTPVVHWIVYSISPTAMGLPEGLPISAQITGGARQGKNYSGKEGYIGPMPPLGHGVHHYHFQLFALDQPMRFSEAPDRDTLLNAMQDHVLAQGELIGTYERMLDDA
jgi:Raf kinase inhibitor-like YbhB/YbcL family protein